MRRNAVRTLRLGLFASIAAGIGCTLINSYDSVAPQILPDGSVAQGDGGPASVGPDGAILGNPGADAGVDAHVDDPATRGAIVVGGTVDVRDGGLDSSAESEAFVLTALDPTTGSELLRAREPMQVSAVVYDGLRDLWYIFESGGASVFPGPQDPFFVHTRTLNTVTGEWTELSKLAIPPGVSFATTTTTAERVSYVAYGDGTDGGSDPLTTFSLVTLDTSNPASVSVSSVLPLPAYPAAAIGTLRPQINQGGLVSLGSSTPGGPPSYAQLTPVLVQSMAAPMMEMPIVGPFASGTQSGFGTATINGTMSALVVTRINKFGPGGPTPPAFLALYDPSASDPMTALIGAGTFPFLDSNLKAPAFAPCAGVAFVVGTNSDTSLHAVSTAGIGQPDDAGNVPTLQATSAPTGHSGQGVYFEPYTNTVLTPFSQSDGFALTAFTLGGTKNAPVLTQRQAPRWVPPAKLRPNFIATKSPVPANCPQTTP